jgi:hypothetical protein
MQFAKTNPEVAPMTVYLLSILHPSFFEAEINDHLSNHGRHEIDKNVARVYLDGEAVYHWTLIDSPIWL